MSKCHTHNNDSNIRTSLLPALEFLLAGWIDLGHSWAPALAQYDHDFSRRRRDEVVLGRDGYWIEK
jgi:hypothetical protein